MEWCTLTTARIEMCRAIVEERRRHWDNCDRVDLRALVRGECVRGNPDTCALWEGRKVGWRSAHERRLAGAVAAALGPLRGDVGGYVSCGLADETTVEAIAPTDTSEPVVLFIRGVEVGRLHVTRWTRGILLPVPVEWDVNLGKWLSGTARLTDESGGTVVVTTVAGDRIPLPIGRSDRVRDFALAVLKCVMLYPLWSVHEASDPILSADMPPSVGLGALPSCFALAVAYRFMYFATLQWLSDGG